MEESQLWKYAKKPLRLPGSKGMLQKAKHTEKQGHQPSCDQVQGWQTVWKSADSSDPALSTGNGHLGQESLEPLPFLYRLVELGESNSLSNPRTTTRPAFQVKPIWR